MFSTSMTSVSVRAFRRAIMGQANHNPPSRFLKDLPPELVHQVAQSVENAYHRPSAAQRPRQPDWSPGFMGTERVSRNGGAQTEVPARSQATYKAGEHVRHGKFGEGIVVSAMQTANGADQEVTVAFKGGFGVKKLLLSFAPLEKLD